MKYFAGLTLKPYSVYIKKNEEYKMYSEKNTSTDCLYLSCLFID